MSVWACGACTFENSEADPTSCAICGTVRDPLPVGGPGPYEHVGGSYLDGGDDETDDPPPLLSLDSTAHEAARGRGVQRDLERQRAGSPYGSGDTGGTDGTTDGTDGMNRTDGTTPTWGQRHGEGKGGDLRVVPADAGGGVVVPATAHPVHPAPHDSMAIREEWDESMKQANMANMGIGLAPDRGGGGQDACR